MKVNAVAEAYPDLKANANFLDLQKQLADTENQLSFARQYYNDAVATLNKLVPDDPVDVLHRHGRRPGPRVLRGPRGPGPGAQGRVLTLPGHTGGPIGPPETRPSRGRCTSTADRSAPVLPVAADYRARSSAGST